MLKDSYEYEIVINFKKTNYYYTVKSFREKNEDDDIQIRLLYPFVFNILQKYNHDDVILYLREISMNENGIIKNTSEGIITMLALGVEIQIYNNHKFTTDVDFYTEFKFLNIKNKNIKLKDEKDNTYLITQKNSFALFDEIYFPTMVDTKLWIDNIDKYYVKMFFIDSYYRRKYLNYSIQNEKVEKLNDHVSLDNKDETIEISFHNTMYKFSHNNIISIKQVL